MSLGLASCPLALTAQIVTLAWNPTANAAGYLVYYGSEALDIDSQTNAGTNVYWTFTGLQPGATYYFDVVAYDVNSNSPPSLLIDYTVPATTSPITYTVVTQTNPAGAGSVTGGGTYTAGASVTVTATASSGYNFSSWTENGNLQSTSTNYSFILTGNRNLVANFTAIPTTCTVAVQSFPAGAGSVAGGGTYPAGSLLTVMATANSGYTFYCWTENGFVQSTSPYYSFTLTANRNLVANFMTNLVTYTVATQTNPAGAGSVTGGGTFVTGSPVTVIATASSGYTFSYWTENNIFLSTLPYYAFTLASDRNLIANFTANTVTYTVTSSAGMNGSINPNGPQTVAAGGNIAFTATPAGGYQINQWLVNDAVAQNGGSSYTLQNVTANMAVAVSFSASKGVSTNGGGTVTTAANAAGTAFTLLISGNGTLAPNRNGKAFQAGKKYTVTATPAKGSVFANWVSNGIVVATTPKYTFLVESNVLLQANFILNPFFPVMGSYRGLFYATNGMAEESSGSFVATVTGTGAFSAKLAMGARSYSYSQAFSATGAALQSIARPALTPIMAQLQLNLSNGPLTGTISGGTWTADLVAAHSIYSKANPAPQAGKYTLLIPGGTNASTQPGGNGFGAVTVDALGNVTFSGILGDGTAAASTSIVSSQGQWPFYVSLYGGNGSILGWLSFSNNGVISGQTGWFKLPQTTARLYPGGFVSGAGAIGSVYSYTSGLPILDFIDGLLYLANGDLPQSITNQLLLGTDLQVSNQSGDQLTFKSSSGLFKGSVMISAKGKPVPVNGVVLQNQNFGAGLFLGPSQSGSVMLAPAR